MSNDEPMAPAGPARRVPRQGMGASPVGSTLSIVLAVVAVVAGFLILRNITDDGGGSADGIAPAGTEVPDSVVDDPATVVDSTTTTTTTTIPRITTGATVAVANANTVGGSAGNMTKTLELQGYTMGDATNASGPNIDDSIVYYDPAIAAALDVANSVALDLGGLAVLPVPTPAPTESGSLGEAGVLVLLGNNQAGKTIEELAVQAGAAEATDDTATAEAPDPAAAGDTTTTTP